MGQYITSRLQSTASDYSRDGTSGGEQIPSRSQDRLRIIRRDLLRFDSFPIRNSFSIVFLFFFF